jgi:hypothetical protein
MMIAIAHSHRPRLLATASTHKLKIFENEAATLALFSPSNSHARKHIAFALAGFALPILPPFFRDFDTAITALPLESIVLHTLVVTRGASPYIPLHCDSLTTGRTPSYQEDI